MQLGGWLGEWVGTRTALARKMSRYKTDRPQEVCIVKFVDRLMVSQALSHRAPLVGQMEIHPMLGEVSWIGRIRRSEQLKHGELNTLRVPVLEDGADRFLRGFLG